MKNKTLDRLTGAAAIVTIVATAYGFFSYLFRHLEGEVLYVLVAVLIGSAGWFAISSHRASRSFRYREPLPWPRWLWPLLFNRLPAMASLITDPTQKTRVLVIFEESSAEIVAQLHTKYVDEHVEIEEFDCTESELPSKRHELIQILSGIDAVYLIWTGHLKSTGWLSQVAIDWALQNSFKPILVINMIPDEPYELPYVALPKEKAVSGLWRLLARSSERGRLWRLRASGNRRAFLVTASLLIASVAITASLFLKERNRVQRAEHANELREAETEIMARKSIEAGVLHRHLTDQLWNTTSFAREALSQVTTLSSQQRLDIRTTLNGYADYIEDTLETLSDTYGAVGSVTFWRIVSYRDESQGGVRECVCEVAWSDGEKQTCFTYDEDSIAGCAFKHGIMILYRSKDTPDYPAAAWSLKGEPIASWSPNGFLVGNNDSFTCFYDTSGNTSHTNLFCMAAAPRGEGAERSGICTETVLESDILESSSVRQFLSSSLTPLHALPESLIATEDAIGKCKAKWDAKENGT